MTSMTVAEAEANFGSVLTRSQAERVVIERDGKPVAIVVGIEGYDAEAVDLARSPDFWRMIADRRTQGCSITLSDLKSELRLDHHEPTDQGGVESLGN